MNNPDPKLDKQKPLPDGQLPGVENFPGAQPTLDRKDPPTGEDTGRQAMLLQPSNGAVVAGAIGLGGMDNYGPWSWGDWARTGGQGQSLQGPSPAPGLFSHFSINGLPTAWPGQYTYFRRVLNDPSVRFVRMLAFAPCLVAKWNVIATKDAPKEAAEYIQEMFASVRLQFLDDAIRGVDYGWAGFEQVFEMLDDDSPRAGAFWLSKIKPFLHDVTSIWVQETGAFAGFQNNGVMVDPVKSVLYTYDGESGNLYGRGRCINLLEVVPWWRDANEGAARYDRKIAGVFMVCHYPPGQSIDNNGKLVENYVIAQQMLDSIAAGKPIAVCNEFAGEMENNFLQNISLADRTRWKLELLEDKGSRQPGFGDRLAYLDRQKARAYLVPERSAFEAQKSGSRADSESHGDIILVQASIINQRLSEILNGSVVERKSVVNNILRMNWGNKAINTVKLVPSAIEDDKKKFVRDVAKEILLGNPEIWQNVTNIQELFEQADMPVPSDPLTSQELEVKLDGMMAKRVSDKGLPSGVTMSREQNETLNRIRKYLDEHDARKLNGHLNGNAA